MAQIRLRLPSAEDCLQEFDVDKDGLLSLGELGDCLNTVLRRSGCEDSCSKRLSGQILEEYSLRADGAAAGLGALCRLLEAARDRASIARSRSRSPARAQGEHAEAKAALFNAEAKEASLQKEAVGWAAPSCLDTIPTASDSEIPTIDWATCHEDREGFVAKLRDACKKVGFFFLVNHGVEHDVLDAGTRLIEEFGSLSCEVKQQYTMDQGRFPSGTGYLPLHSRKLPRRPKGNVVEAFIVKREHGPRNIRLEDMPWPRELGMAWRSRVEQYAAAMEELARKLLPFLSAALGEADSYLDPAFQSPLWRLRLSRYPACSGYEDGQYGIAPHVDTSFFTLLHRSEIESSSVVWAFCSERWVRVPTKPGALVVNAGEILRQVSNDTFQSARHYVLNASDHPRSSLAFFFNATADFKMPVAVGAGGGPAKYPPSAYLDSQGVVQGE